MPVCQNTGTLRSLIVDDNLDAARSLSQLLAAMGAKSFVATDPGEAINLASRVLPHIVLLDLVMPRMDGFTVARRLRESELPPFLLAALTGRPDARSICDPHDFDLFVLKPAMPEQLKELLGTAKALRAVGSSSSSRRLARAHSVVSAASSLSGSDTVTTNASLDRFQGQHKCRLNG